MTRILLLGGTSDATALARLLSETGADAIFSYAGRVSTPTPQPLPMRVGGFGGVEGLVAYLRAEKITHVVDATHAFAAQMSRNAVAACAEAGVALAALERAPWAAQAGDTWHPVVDIAGAIDALPDAPARVFLATGRQSVAEFAAKPQHFYLLRYIEPPKAIPLPDYIGLAGRGPFTVEGDTALMQTHRITHLIAKNAGGEAARAKLDAARTLHIPVIMIERPPVPQRQSFERAEDVMGWLSHRADLGV